MSEQSKIDAERAAFNDYLNEVVETKHYGMQTIKLQRHDEYTVDDEKIAWDAWHARASLPVGVPDGYVLVPVEPTPEMLRAGVDQAVGAYPIYRAMLAAAPAAPTVKAEQVQCCTPTAEEKAMLAAGDYTPEELWGGPRPTCHKCIGKAPSLPAAGSAVEEVEVVAHVAIDDPTPEEHGDWDIEPDAEKLNELARRGGGHIPLMTVAQHNRIVGAIPAKPAALAHGIGIPSVAEFGEWVDLNSPDPATRGMLLALFKWTLDRVCVLNANHAALSAQQSAPERVSVPRDALQWPLEIGVEAQQKAADAGCDREDCLHDGLQAMLAEISSHGRGEA